MSEASKVRQQIRALEKSRDGALEAGEKEIADAMTKSIENLKKSNPESLIKDRGFVEYTTNVLRNLFDWAVGVFKRALKWIADLLKSVLDFFVDMLDDLARCFN